MGKDVLFSGLCRDVKYLTHAFKMCQGLEVEGLRYETGVIRVWFGYDSRSTIQHTVSDLDRSYNGQSAPEAGRCKRYRLPQWSYSGQCRDPWSPNNNHQQAFKNDLHFGGLLRGMLRGYASGCASGVCFARAPPSTNTYLGPREKNTNPFVHWKCTEKTWGTWTRLLHGTRFHGWAEVVN